MSGRISKTRGSPVQPPDHSCPCARSLPGNSTPASGSPISLPLAATSLILLYFAAASRCIQLRSSHSEWMDLSEALVCTLLLPYPAAPESHKPFPSENESRRTQDIFRSTAEMSVWPDQAD